MASDGHPRVELLTSEGLAKRTEVRRDLPWIEPQHGLHLLPEGFTDLLHLVGRRVAVRCQCREVTTVRICRADILGAHLLPDRPVGIDLVDERRSLGPREDGLELVQRVRGRVVHAAAAAVTCAKAASTLTASMLAAATPPLASARSRMNEG